jgi:crotonobetainyl-CoA:carnitine CoA-transferase CaiB-like acyl-CoA transferase
MTGPLASLRVVEIAQGLAAPFAGKLLADYGADVVKVEPPGGDWLRRRGPFASDQPGPESSAAFSYVNTSKRSAAINVDTPGGQALVARLVANADVLIEDTPAGWLEERGLAPATLRAANPGLVVASVTPFGRTGPLSSWRGDELISSHAGGMAFLGRPRGFGVVRSELTPLRPGANLSSFFAGIATAVAVLIALYQRRVTGRGQEIDLSVQDVVIAALGPTVAHLPYQGHVVGTAATPASAPIVLMRCRDGFVWLQCSEELHWRNFVAMMGDPDWAELEVFKDRFARGQHWDALEPLLLEWTLQHDK